MSGARLPKIMDYTKSWLPSNRMGMGVLPRHPLQKFRFQIPLSYIISEGPIFHNTFQGVIFFTVSFQEALYCELLVVEEF